MCGKPFFANPVTYVNEQWFRASITMGIAKVHVEGNNFYLQKAGLKAIYLVVVDPC